MILYRKTLIDGIKFKRNVQHSTSSSSSSSSSQNTSTKACSKLSVRRGTRLTFKKCPVFKGLLLYQRH